MVGLSGTKTHEHLLQAFARASQVGLRYVWFAQQADIEGRPAAAALFRSVADGETGHVLDLLEFLAEVGDPVTGGPIGDTEDNLRAAIAGETHEYTHMLPDFANTARDEGFQLVAEWFETLARAEQGQAGRFAEALESFG
jgi:rubrerythrin